MVKESFILLIMHVRFFLFIAILSTEKAFPQIRMRYQSPGVYKENHVKSRAKINEGGSFLSVEVDYFDHNGLLSETAFYDTSGIVCLSKSIFKYDSTQQLVAQTNYQYQYMDMVTKQPAIKSIPDSQVVKFEFDTKNRLVKKSFFSHKTLFQFEYKYDPLVEILSTFDTDSTKLISIWHFDDHKMEKDISSIRYTKDNVELYGAIYSFKNTYNKAGNLIRRKIKLVSDPAKSKEIYFRNEVYRYIDNGLLVSSIMFNTNDSGDRFGPAWLYSYKFW